MMWGVWALGARDGAEKEPMPCSKLGFQIASPVLELGP